MRLLPGVMGNEASAGEESFSADRLEWTGAFENQQRAVKRLAIIVPLTLVAVPSRSPTPHEPDSFLNETTGPSSDTESPPQPGPLPPQRYW